MWDSLIARLEVSEKRLTQSLQEVRNQLAAARDAKARQADAFPVTGKK